MINFNKGVSTPIAITIIIVLAVILIGGVFVYRYYVVPGGETNQKIVLLPLIKGCAETDKGMATKSFGEEIERSPSIEVTGNEIKYSRAINHLCCRKADIQKEINNSVINIFEVWDGVGCKCMCFSEIEATLTNIPSGDYTVNVYETGIKPGDGEPMEQELIITQEINIK